MSVSDKVGLLPGFGWIAGHHPVVTLLICWLLTPGAMFVIGLVFESRLVPIQSDKQFLSFLPGDLFLGGMAAGLLMLARDLPGGTHFYNARWWHILVLILMAAIAVTMTLTEWKSGIYPTRAIFSPTKLYHNGVLYIGYAYVIVTTLVAVAAGSDWSSVRVYVIFGISLAVGGVWVYLVIKDNSLGSAGVHQKARYAHVKDWIPLWILP